MTCTVKKTECREWLRKGDLACRKCPQEEDEEAVHEASIFRSYEDTGDEEDDEDPEPGDGDEEESVESMREALDDVDYNLGMALGALDTAATYACGPAKDAVKKAESLLTEARKLVAPYSNE